MKSMLAIRLAIAASLCLALPAFGTDKPREPSAACVAEAKGLKGEEREKAIARCEKLASGGDQQNRMKTCNADAKKNDLHGDERRAFMSRCLKGEKKS